MQPLSAIVVSSLAVPILLLGACRVERTPEEYFDHESVVEAERRAAGAEVRDRLLAFVGAAARGDGAGAVIALHPAESVEVVGPGGLEVRGAAGLRGVIAQLVTTAVAVRVREIDVRTGPAGGVAWFRMVVEAPGLSREPSLYDATGTYLRDAGLWELVQAHVSGPVTTDSTSSLSGSGATPAGGE